MLHGSSLLDSVVEVHKNSSAIHNSIPASGDNQSLVSAGKKSSSSLLSMTSLKKRLVSKYSKSAVGDVYSLIGRLTTSSFSYVSSLKSKGKVRDPSVQASTSYSREHGTGPLLHAFRPSPIPSTTLPGILPRYCWEHMKQDQMQECDDIRLPCNRYPMFQLVGNGSYQSVSSDILGKIKTESILASDLETFDSFRNTVLHIAATLGSRPSYITSLILLGADVNCLNNAGQTFLHLMELSSCHSIGSLDSLLGTLVQYQFDFQQQDQNGQTAIHALTHEDLPWRTLDSLIHSFFTHEVEFPVCRDNLGNTISQHLLEKGFVPSDPIRYSRKSIYEPPTHVWGEVHSIQEMGTQLFENSDVPNDHQNIDAIEKMMETIEYESHAEMQKTIIGAGIDPLYEDNKGRNGLHCLAKKLFESQRECYLDGLLRKGVNPNSYDNQGFTPLMSFVHHVREEESEQDLDLLVARMLEAGADINNRNRQGETALHLAVKLGRRVATKILLSHGANLHARNSSGLGVLALGMKYSNRAAQVPALYAQITLCTFLVGSAGAIPAPTIVDEWSSPELIDLESSSESRDEVEGNLVSLETARTFDGSISLMFAGFL
ncbi:ankyrin repeat-containing domain protein [Cadophora sp. MPI-SDFR-AT-0126]|nr:ankyrin repeat-containing domain protein [Leotiomycetes sp. MPI-SDFR-AT-0126]